MAKRFERYDRGAARLQVINLRGTARERGQQYGKALGRAIKGNFLNYRQAFEAKGLTWEKVQDLAFLNT